MAQKWLFLNSTFVEYFRMLISEYYTILKTAYDITFTFSTSRRQTITSGVPLALSLCNVINLTHLTFFLSGR